MSADVVVAGYGPAGACAAIAAHDAGRDVVVVESAGRGGGNARYSGGFLFDVPGPEAVDHLDALCFGRTERVVLEAYAEGLHGIDQWLRSLGGDTAPFDPPPGRLPAPFPSWPHFPAGKTIRYRTVADGNGRRGEALWDLLDAAVRARDIPVRFGTAAERLLIADDGSVTGLAVSDGGRPATLGANRGVVLACGGFEADPGLADTYLPLGPSWPVGHPGNTGAGLRMAQQAGAALWHMYGCFGWFAFRTPEFPAPFALDFFGASHLLVDGDGHRFADETGLDPGTLARTLDRYNAAARAGRDEEFGRSADTLVPLDTSRLFAIKTWPGVAGTTGGPRHDERARVLRPRPGTRRWT